MINNKYCDIGRPPACPRFQTLFQLAITQVSFFSTAKRGNKTKVLYENVCRILYETQATYMNITVGHFCSIWVEPEFIQFLSRDVDIAQCSALVMCCY